MADAVGVKPHLTKIFVERLLELQPVLLRGQSLLLDHLAGQRVEVVHPQFQAEVAALEFREVERVVDQPVKPVDVALGQGKEVFLVLVERAGGAVLDHVDGFLDGRERCTQLVRDH